MVTIRAADGNRRAGSVRQAPARIAAPLRPNCRASSASSEIAPGPRASSRTEQRDPDQVIRPAGRIDEQLDEQRHADQRQGGEARHQADQRSAPAWRAPRRSPDRPSAPPAGTAGSRRYSSWNKAMVSSKLASLVDAARQKMVAIAARASSATALYGILFARSRRRRAWWTRAVMASPWSSVGLGLSRSLGILARIARRWRACRQPVFRADRVEDLVRRGPAMPCCTRSQDFFLVGTMNSRRWTMRAAGEARRSTLPIGRISSAWARGCRRRSWRRCRPARRSRRRRARLRSPGRRRNCRRTGNRSGRRRRCRSTSRCRPRRRADQRGGDGGGDGAGEDEGGLHGRGLLMRWDGSRSAGDAKHLPSPQASDPAQSAKMPCSHSLHNATASGKRADHNALNVRERRVPRKPKSPARRPARRSSTRAKDREAGVSPAWARGCRR